MRIASIVLMIAASGMAQETASSLPFCRDMYNIGILLYDPVVEQKKDALVKCLSHSKFDAAISGNRGPNREEISLFFDSDDCRQVVEALQENYRMHGQECTVDLYGTPIGQMSTLTFDELKEIFQPFISDKIK